MRGEDDAREGGRGGAAAAAAASCGAVMVGLYMTPLLGSAVVLDLDLLVDRLAGRVQSLRALRLRCKAGASPCPTRPPAARRLRLRLRRVSNREAFPQRAQQIVRRVGLKARVEQVVGCSEPQRSPGVEALLRERLRRLESREPGRPRLR